ncbi:PrgI family protein [Candidatus Gottesmanbacteria bacterium]|nr:PrgI family protein [Candidatus Gottesmanbacteria bacterium]
MDLLRQFAVLPMAMEQHPVPQNITTFQFRLIGDMTIKQFAYLAGGAIVAYISYKLPLPFFLTWPLAIFSALLGFGLAFVPIEERPMDVWILSFLKNTYNPTLFIWQQRSIEIKKTPDIKISTNTTQTVKTVTPTPGQPQSSHVSMNTPAHSHGHQFDILSQTLTHFTTWASSLVPHQQSFSSQGKQSPTSTGTTTMLSSHKESTLMDNLKTALEKQKTASQNISTTTMPATQQIHSSSQNVFETSGQTHTETSMNTTSVALPDEPTRIKKLESEISSVSTLRASQEELHHIEDLKQQLDTLLKEKSQMSQELERFKKTVAGQKSIPVYYPSRQPSSVHIASPGPKINSGVPRLTTFPNVANGIIKDSNGNMLPGILVTIKDHDGVPMRALKTNKLGQFAASTPLQPGEYVIEIEDPRNQFAFDKTKLNIDNSILPAVEIIAKSQKEIARAKLAMDIFGKNI